MHSQSSMIKRLKEAEDLATNTSDSSHGVAMQSTLTLQTTYFIDVLNSLFQGAGNVIKASFIGKLAAILPWIAIPIFVGKFIDTCKSIYRLYNAKNRNYERYADVAVNIITTILY